MDLFMVHITCERNESGLKENANRRDGMGCRHKLGYEEKTQLVARYNISEVPSPKTNHKPKILKPISNSLRATTLYSALKNLRV